MKARKPGNVFPQSKYDGRTIAHILAAREHVPWLQRTISIFVSKTVPSTNSLNLTGKWPALVDMAEARK